jgi:signal transduction histidine kinase
MNQEHILVVDDEENLLNSIDFILTSEGYRVSCAKGGQQALDVISNLQKTGNSIDLVITDIQMPDMNGIELIKTMQDRKMEIPIIVITGFGNKEILLQCLRQGCVDYMDKPFSLTGLATRVRAVLGKVEKEHLRWRQVETLASIGNLAGEVAHDFNNLVSVASGYADLASEKVAVDNPIQRDLQNIQKASSRASHLADGLLSCIRTKGTAEKEEEVTTVLNGMIDLLKCLAGKKTKLIVKQDTTGESFPVLKSAVERIVMNLVTNARDAMPNGGIVTIQTGFRSLSLCETKKSPHCSIGLHGYISIADTGTGMDQETLKQIFNPFFTTKCNGKGTGLGLSVVQKIVKEQGGSISVESEVGKGTTFIVYLPVKNR